MVFKATITQSIHWPNTIIWVRSRNCSCLVTWFCYRLIAKPGSKTAAVSWPDPYNAFYQPIDVLYLLLPLGNRPLPKQYWPKFHTASSACKVLSTGHFTKVQGWGSLVQLPLFCYFSIFSASSKHTLDIEYHVAATPVKYECDSKNLRGTFACSKILLMEKLTNGALVTPTPGPILKAVRRLTTDIVESWSPMIWASALKFHISLGQRCC